MKMNLVAFSLSRASILLVLTSFPNSAWASMIIVGGSEHWHFGFNCTNWALKSAPFDQNDILVFKYDPPNMTTFPHSVYLLKNQQSFFTSNLTQAKLVGDEMRGGGEGLQFKLKKTKAYYFACGERGGIHCKLGLMKFTAGGHSKDHATLAAMRSITKEIFMQNEDFLPIKPMDRSKFLVLCLGTGPGKQEEKFSAQESARWGLLGWLRHKGTTPLIDVFSQASADMVDIHASTLFQVLNSGPNYLRIQSDSLIGDTASVDISTKVNLESLVQVGKELLKQPVSRVNIETGLFEVVDGEGTNEEALTRFAKLLSDERRRRLNK